MRRALDLRSHLVRAAVEFEPIDEVAAENGSSVEADLLRCLALPSEAARASLQTELPTDRSATPLV